MKTVYANSGGGGGGAPTAAQRAASSARRQATFAAQRARNAGFALTRGGGVRAGR